MRAGPVTRRFLAPHPVVLQVGSTVFVHGGVLPQHAALGVGRINADTAAWLRGDLPRMPGFLSGRQAVVWARDYSTGARAARPHPLREAVNLSLSMAEMSRSTLPTATRTLLCV